MEEIVSNFESLSEEDMSKYAGEWIAVIDNKLVAHSSSLKEVYEFTKQNYPNKKPLIGRLPEDKLIILSLS